MSVADTIIITLGGEAIALRPTLRNAMRLEARPGSLPQLMREVAEESLTAACAIIGQHTDLTPEKQDRILNALPFIKFALVSYVTACFGVTDDDAPEADKATEKAQTVSLAEHLAGLYRVATGWLSWSPEQALNATPLEIREAQKGRLEMLRAIFGGGDSKPKSDSVPFTDDNVRSVFASFGTVKVSGAE